MDIIELLQKTGARVSYEDKWLVYDSLGWTVYQRKPYAKQTICLYCGIDLDKSIAILIGEDKEI